MQARQLTAIISLLRSCDFKSSKLLAQVVLIIISIGHIGLYKIACKINSKATKHDSKERALRRLLDKPIIAESYARLIDILFKVSENSYEFAMDRTNWKLGRTSINLLVLSFNWHDIAIPLYWIFLDNNGGNSNTDDRISLISWLIKHYRSHTVVNLFADREFPSIEFLGFLLQENVNFVFRIKDNIVATDTVKGKLLLKKLHQLFKKLVNSNFVAETKIRKLLDNRLFVSARRNHKGELIVLVSNQFHQNPFELYARRWNIECLFNKTKTKGFNMESSHITKPDRIVALFTIIAIAYSYCCYIGQFKHSINPIKEKYIHNIRQKSKSIFRAGLDLIQHVIAYVFFGNKIPLLHLTAIFTGNPIKQGSTLYNIMLNF